MNTKRKKSSSIHVHAAMALMLIQLVHKIVREIPGAIDMGGPGAVAVPVFAGLLNTGRSCRACFTFSLCCDKMIKPCQGYLD